jgi:hypothetical protein
MLQLLTAIVVGSVALWAARWAARRQPQRWRWAPVLVLFGGAICVGDSYTRPLLDDGPFRGEPVDQPPAGISQTLVLTSRLTLLSYDPQPGQSYPVVCVVAGADPLQPASHCVRARGHDQAEVRGLYFHTAHRALWNVVAEGTVDWTYGRERMQFLIGPTGRVREYWYSW